MGDQMKRLININQILVQWRNCRNEVYEKIKHNEHIDIDKIKSQYQMLLNEFKKPKYQPYISKNNMNHLQEIIYQIKNNKQQVTQDIAVGKYHNMFIEVCVALDKMMKVGG
jgi:hypothetical protein